VAGHAVETVGMRGASARAGGRRLAAAPRQLRDGGPGGKQPRELD